MPHPAQSSTARGRSIGHPNECQRALPGAAVMPRAAAALALALSLAGLAPPPARAAEGIYLTWDDCFQGPTATSNISFACNSNTGQQELYVAFTMPQAANNVLAVEAVIDLQHSSVVLPDWWRLDPNGCRWDDKDFTLAAAANFPGRSACLDMWQGAATPAIAQVADYIPTKPGGAASQSRMKVTASVLPPDARTLDGSSMYYAVRIILKNTRTVGDMSCPGCSNAACLVLNSILVGRLAGSPGGDIFLQMAGSGDANWARWQGGSGANCSAVPVRSRAWGQLKGLYR